MPSNEIQGFKTVPVNFFKDGTSVHELFMKEHSVRHEEDNKPPGRTLFLLNIPPYITEETLKSIFSKAGKISTVILQKNPSGNLNGFKMAYIVFSKRESLLKALQASSLAEDPISFKTGLDKWIDEYNNSIGDPVKLSKEINNFMLNYDKSEEGKKLTKEVDNEGWTVVSRKGRKPGVARKESVKIKINEKISQANKRKELRNFYTFQIKESKQKNLEMLRKNYEDAKKKVNLMKSSRRFKPY